MIIRGKNLNIYCRDEDLLDFQLRSVAICAAHNNDNAINLCLLFTKLVLYYP